MVVVVSLWWWGAWRCSEEAQCCQATLNICLFFRRENCRVFRFCSSVEEWSPSRGVLADLVGE